jgi:hypothetical protein
MITFNIILLKQIMISIKFLVWCFMINKFVQYSEGDILCKTSRLFVAIHSIALFTLLIIDVFYPAFQWYDVMTK